VFDFLPTLYTPYSVLEIYDPDDITAPCFFPADGGKTVRVSKLTISIIRPDTSYILSYTEM